MYWLAQCSTCFYQLRYESILSINKFKPVHLIRLKKLSIKQELSCLKIGTQSES